MVSLPHSLYIYVSLFCFLNVFFLSLCFHIFLSLICWLPYLVSFLIISSNSLIFFSVISNMLLNLFIELFWVNFYRILIYNTENCTAFNVQLDAFHKKIPLMLPASESRSRILPAPRRSFLAFCHSLFLKGKLSIHTENHKLVFLC